MAASAHIFGRNRSQRDRLIGRHQASHLERRCAPNSNPASVDRVAGGLATTYQPAPDQFGIQTSTAHGTIAVALCQIGTC